MEPTPQSPASAPVTATGEAIVEYVRTNRQNVGIVFAVLAVLALSAGVFLAVKAFGASSEKPPEKEKSPAEKMLEPEKAESPKSDAEIANVRRADYTVGWVACLVVSLSLAGGAAWLIFSLPPPTAEAQRSDARVLLLIVGQAVGTAIILAGLRLFYGWSDSLLRWLNTNETRELRWVVIPVLMIVFGAGLVFLAIQPARAEERNNSRVRRTVYGANFGLTVLLLFVALVVVNVFITVKVPNKLDATATGFYDLSDTTTRLLSGLKEPITAYAILPGGMDRDIADIRQVLFAIQDASGGRFKVKFLSQVTEKGEVNSLRAKYPQLDLVLEQRTASGAVLLTVGEDEKRHAVIPDSEFIGTSQQDGKTTFQGEARLFRELVVLADTDTKPVVYFTQSNGELSIAQQDDATLNRKAARLRTYLEKNYLEVRPLKFTLDNPVVPPDAAVVVVAEPRIPFSPAAAAALRKYMTNTDKRGKLVVLAGTVPGPNNQGMVQTGLEDLLRELNVQLGSKFVYTAPRTRNAEAMEATAGFTRAAIQARSEVALAIAKATSTMTMRLPREVLPGNTTPTLQAMPLMASVGLTWLEADRIPDVDLEDRLRQLAENAKVREAKDFTEDSRPLAVLVTEGGNPRAPGSPVAAVFGTAYFVTDEFARRWPPETAPITFDLVGVTIDWLRGRPSIAASGIEAKKYSEYQFPAASAVDTSRLIYLPLWLALLGIVGFGAGVWVVRRK